MPISPCMAGTPSWPPATASMLASMRCSLPRSATSPPPLSYKGGVAFIATKPSEWRRLLRSDRLRRVLCWAIHHYIRFVFATNRWQIEGGEVPRRLQAQGRPFILAFWHGRLLMIPMAWRRLAPMHMLISGHRDGRIIADAVRYFGVDSIAGSSNQGGTGALRAMIRYLKASDCVGIPPGGPNRPAMRATPAILIAANISPPPPLPVTYPTPSPP